MFAMPLSTFHPLIGWLSELTEAKVVLYMQSTGIYLQMQGMGNTVMLDVVVPRESCVQWRLADDDQMHKLPLGTLKTITANAGGASLLRMHLPNRRHPDHFIVETCAPAGNIIVQTKIPALELGDDMWLSTAERTSSLLSLLSATVHTQELRLFVSQARTFGLDAVRVAPLDAMTLEPPAAGAAPPSVLELYSAATGGSLVTSHRMLFTNMADDDVPAPVDEVAGGKRKAPADADARKRRARTPNTVRDLRVYGDASRFGPQSMMVKIVDRLLVCSSFCATADLSLLARYDPAGPPPPGSDDDDNVLFYCMRFHVDADALIQMQVFIAPMIAGTSADD